MAEVSATLFFKGNRKYSVGAIEFDLLLSESHTMANKVTEHPVEDGSIISDHIQTLLDSGSLTGLITNFSIYQDGLFSNRAQEAFDKIDALIKSKELVKVVTIMKVYENVALTNVSVNRDSSTGETISLNVSFRQFNYVKLEQIQIEASVSIEDMGTDDNRQAAPETNVGRTVGI